MIGYHPALDPHHAALRALRLVSHLGLPSIAVEKLRILDFFMLFPSEIAEVRLPRSATGWRATFRDRANPYWMDGDRNVVYSHMTPVYTAGLRLLAAAGRIDAEALERGEVTLGELPRSLEDLLSASSDVEMEALTFLRDVFAELPLTGDSGLKARTGLAEHRYDATT